MRFIWWTFLAILLANAILFLVASGRADKGTEPMRAHRELNPEKIGLLPPPAAPASSRTQVPAVAAEACMEWKRIPAADSDQVRTWLSETLSAEKVDEVVANGTVRGFWVYVPPAPSRQTALQSIEELKQKGVADYLLIQGEGRWQNAISLGVFSSAEAAQRHLEKMHQKGVGAAVAGPRTPEGAEITFALRGLSADEKQRLLQLYAGAPIGTLDEMPCPQ